MKKLAFGITAFLGTILGVALVFSIFLFVYYYPVLDRLYFNSCSYYPEAFSDCK